MKILIVDDDQALRESLADNLREEGWYVIEAGDATAAEQFVADAELVVSDIKMPGRDGLTCLPQADGNRENLTHLQSLLGPKTIK